VRDTLRIGEGDSADSVLSHENSIGERKANISLKFPARTADINTVRTLLLLLTAMVAFASDRFHDRHHDPLGGIPPDIVKPASGAQRPDKARLRGSHNIPAANTHARVPAT
jgi:hypothetical protein